MRFASYQQTEAFMKSILTSTIATKLALLAALTGTIITTYAQDNQPSFLVDQKILTGAREIATSS
jgi:hypothetical protein